MRWFSRFLSVLPLVLGTALLPAREAWVSAYYPGWESGKLPPAELPFDAFTHLFQFALSIEEDGGLDLERLGLTEALLRSTVEVAHAKGKKVSIVLGGADSAEGFRGATSPEHLNALVDNVIGVVERYGYDGVDLDWEPMAEADFPRFTALVEALRPRLDALGRPMILSAATAPSYEAPRTPELYAGLQRHFDQVNLMTYVLSGPWEGWISWHGSPLGNGGGKFPGGRDLPSIERDMALFAKAGVAKEKLGIGLAFHGDIWTGGSGTPTGGVTAPRQLWTTPPGIERDVAYSAILAKYAASAVAGYDAVARTPYFSVDHAEDARDVFVSYCDAAAITARLEFMAREGYGGCIVWQITQDRLPDGSQPLAAALVRFRAQ